MSDHPWFKQIELPAKLQEYFWDCTIIEISYQVIKATSIKESCHTYIHSVPVASAQHNTTDNHFWMVPHSHSSVSSYVPSGQPPSPQTLHLTPQQLTATHRKTPSAASFSTYPLQLHPRHSNTLQQSSIHCNTLGLSHPLRHSPPYLLQLEWRQTADSEN